MAGRNPQEVHRGLPGRHRNTEAEELTAWRRCGNEVLFELCDVIGGVLFLAIERKGFAVVFSRRRA